MTRYHINLYYYVQKAQSPGQYVTNRKRKSKSWLLATQRIIRLLILTRFLCPEKEITVFTDPKDRQVKHYYPNKKAVILSIGSGQKEFLRVQSNQESSFFKRTWNLYLREIIFATYVGVLTIETFFNREKCSCLNRSF